MSEEIQQDVGIDSNSQGSNFATVALKYGVRLQTHGGRVLLGGRQPFVHHCCSQIHWPLRRLMGQPPQSFGDGLLLSRETAGTEESIQERLRFVERVIVIALPFQSF
jgi:hypothetical protein